MDFLSIFYQADETYLQVFQAILRYLAPVLVFVILLRCAKPLITFRREPEIWAWLCLSDGKRLPITHWENVIGSNKSSDIVVDKPEISDSHAVLTRYDDGSWTIADTDCAGGIKVNGKAVDIAPLKEGDRISIGDVKMKFLPMNTRQKGRLAQLRTQAAFPVDSLANLVLLSIFQCLCALSYLMNCGGIHAPEIVIGFSGIMICQWLLLFFYLCIKKPSFEVETLAFLLCTMGMAAIASVRPGEMTKQLIAMVLGIILFLSMGWALRDLERAKKMRYVAGVVGIGLLLITLIFGKKYHGATNWLSIAGVSLQPSELSKVCFVFMGASAMDRILTKRNLILFIGYSAAMCLCLAAMNDFGTALIFFVGFLLIAYLRSGSIGTVTLACASVTFAGVLVVRMAPHALQRFATWRHIWDDPSDTGYHQTQALMCIASGGLFGLGAGNGKMHNVFAADSDVVFATISEEWGILMAIMLVIGIVVWGLFALRMTGIGRSTFYTIGSCTAAGILLMQAILNVLGTLDILPFTGVTFPFVSNGGSSMLGAWGLLAFIKAADTRQNASFAVRQEKKAGGVYE